MTTKTVPADSQAKGHDWSLAHTYQRSILARVSNVAKAAAGLEHRDQEYDDFVCQIESMVAQLAQRRSC